MGEGLERLPRCPSRPEQTDALLSPKGGPWVGDVVGEQPQLRPVGAGCCRSIWGAPVGEAEEEGCAPIKANPG